MKGRVILVGLIASLPFSLHGQRLEMSETIFSYDWFTADRHLMRLDDPEGAIRMYSRRIEANPQDSVASNNLGIAYALREDYATALFMLEKAVALAPENRAFRRNLDQLRTKTRLAWQIKDRADPSLTSTHREGQIPRALPKPVVVF